jgi:hypothetical protein
MRKRLTLFVFILLTCLQVPLSLAWAYVFQTSADTLVHTLDEQGQAALKPIASLKVGDKVLAKSEWKAEGESLSYEPITDVMVTPMQPRRVVDIWLEDGTHLTATEGHPFKTPEGWRDAILLKKGGKLLLPGEAQGEVEITQIAHRVEALTTYNLEVANAHTFFVGNDGVLVHNSGPGVYVDYGDYDGDTGHYAGQSNDTDRRLKEHQKNRRKKNHTRKCEIPMPGSSKGDRDRMENFIYDTLGDWGWPTTNKRRPPNKGK